MLNVTTKHIRLRKLVGGTALAAGLFAAANTANAIIQYDLRFTDGSKTMVAAAGPVTVNIWATITKSTAFDGDIANDGIRFARGYLTTSNTSGGVFNASAPNAVAGTFGVQSVTPLFGFSVSDQAGKLSGPTLLDGTGVNVSGAPLTAADNLRDWGVLAANTLDADDPGLTQTGVQEAFGTTTALISFSSGISNGSVHRSRTTTEQAANPGTAFITNPDGSFQMLIGSFVFDGGAVNGAATPGATTTINFAKGSGTGSSLSNHLVDGSVISINSATNYPYNPATNAVTFTVAAPSGDPTLSVTPGSAAFSMLVNGIANPVTVTVNNTGNAAATMNAPNISNATLFTASAVSPNSLPATNGSGTSNIGLAAGATASELALTNGTVAYSAPGMTNLPGASTVNTSLVVGLASLDGSNSSVNPGPSLITVAAANTNFPTANWSSRTSNLTATGGGPASLNTTATILRYDNTTGVGTGTETVSMAWRTRTSAEANLAQANAVLSDIVRIQGMGTAGTDVGTFVLQMSYLDGTLSGAGLNESAIAISGELRLGWKNGSNQWVTARDGNVGTNTGTFQGVGAYNPSNPAHNLLGAYGVDPSTNNVWAVLNHNSEFAVIPEPSTMILGSLAALGFGYVGLRRRRAK